MPRDFFISASQLEALGIARQARRLLGSVKRRGAFKFRYLSAILQKKKISKLQASVAHKFDHPWVTRVEQRYLPHANPEYVAGKFVKWDAPIAISVFRNSENEQKLVVCMSLYVVNNVAHIVQLQGVSAFDLPAALLKWAGLFVEACQQFAIDAHLSHVRVAKAQSLYSFHNAQIEPGTPEAMATTKHRIQSKMLLLYDGTARELGFSEAGEWYVWENPKYCH